jgi:tRNA pseudouridine65 synthase
MLEIIYQDEWLVAVNKPSGWLVHRSWLDRDEKVVVMQTVRDQIGQHVYRPSPRQADLRRAADGAVQRSGRLLSQQFEQHQIQKRYHAIVRGWLMDEAVLDYPLVEELDKIADKFARDDKGPQPAVTHYRGLATVEMPVATGRYPTTRYGLVELEPKPAASTSCAAIWRIAIRLLATASTAICGKTAAPQSISAVADAARQRAVVDASVYRRAADPARRAGRRLDAGAVTVWLARASP